jgi:signal transduction histidine kinase
VVTYANSLLYGVSIANALVGLAVFARNSRNRANIYFLGLALSISVWTLTNAIFKAVPHDILLAVALASYAAAISAAGFFCVFIFQFTKRRPVPEWLILLLTAVTVMCSLIPGFMASGVTYSYSIITTPGIALLVAVVFIVFTLGFTTLVSYSRRSKTVERTQAQFMLAGMAIAAAAAVIFNLILPLMHLYDYVAYGPAFTTFLVAAVAYAIIRHRLFDIRIVIARSAAYTLLLASLTLIYGGVSLALSQFLFKSGSVSTAQSAANTVLALILAFLFQPLRRFFEKITDRIFYRDRYDSQVVINELSQIFVSELHIERILKKSLTALCEALHIEFGQIIVFSNDHVYRVEHYGPLPKRLMVAPELATLNRSMLIADELEGGERKRLLEEHGVRVSMMLSSREGFIGYLLLGDKLSGNIYSDQDIKLLEILGKELAVAILNARSFAEIAAFNQHLQERVDHATKRLRVANRHLKELDRVKDEFISMASHQLRTPLTTIKGYLSMMLEGDVGPIPDQQREFVTYAFTSSERMVNLISDLLNVSRLQAGRFIIQTKPTDMVKMIDEEVHQLHSHAEAKGLALVFDHPKQALPEIEIDENKTRQVIMNFIDNAIYYTQQGEVRVMLEQTGDLVRMLVKDTGIGVPEQAKKKLFSKFFRAGNAQTVRPDGTGLGLYLAKRVVEDQGGTIIFDSVEGKGSTFGFELPIKHPVIDKKEVTHGRLASRK